MLKLLQPLTLLMLVLALGACSTQTVKTTAITPLESTPAAAIPEDELLDVGIAIFDPGFDEMDEDQAELTFDDVRQAETYYAAHLLSRTLQNSGNWGVVRVIPGDLSATDVAVRGTILQSDGETMVVNVEVSDSTGRLWYEKEYEEVVSQYSYDPRLRRSADAFQGLYNRIANDLLEYRQEELARQELLTIRTVSRIQFAKDFAPEVFDQYLAKNNRGILEVKRLPAQNDPLMQRIAEIRERDNLFVDTMQDYYTNFSRRMEDPYNEFRRLSYEEVMKLDRLQARSRRNMILGVAAILGGLAATQSSNAAAPYATYGGILGGGWLIKDAFDKKDEAQLHVEALAELGNSLESEIAPQTIELEERTVTLTGNVEAQYEQWRELLAEIYAIETGQALPQDSGESATSTQ